MDLDQWISADFAGMKTRLFDSVVRLVPADRWHEAVDGGGSTLTHLLFHLARHQDLAVNAVLRGDAALFHAHRESLGLSGVGASVGLSEAEARDASSLIDPEPLLAYVEAVFDATARWLGASLGDFDAVPDSGAALAGHGGLDEADVPWLFAMWRDKPAWWFLQWPVIGHGNAHTGEAISVRNRMGLSPF